MEIVAESKVPHTTRVKLTPRDPEIKKYLNRIDLWITDDNYPIQEKLWEPSGDTILVNYSNVRINPHISVTAFDLHPAPNVKIEYPQR